MTIILIGLVIIIYTRLFSKDDSNHNQSRLLTDMEETFEHFALEIEDDNKRVLDHILVLKEQFDQQNTKLLTRIELLEKQLSEKPKAPIVGHVKRPSSQIDVTPQEKPLPQSDRMDIKQRYSQLFELHDVGKSMDYIAKKLSINKGEVQLILQLGNQEEQSRV